MSPSDLEAQVNGCVQHGVHGGDTPPVPDVPSDAEGHPVALVGCGDGRAAAITSRATPSGDFPQPRSLLDDKGFVWDEDSLPIQNYLRLGRRLAAAGDLYRRPGYGSGLLLAIAQPNIEPVIVDKGSRLASIIADRVRVRVMKGGNTRGSHIPSTHLSTMLASEVFLQQFPPVDDVIKVATYLPDFSLLKPGYNDGGPGMRLLYVGPEARVERTPEAITSFLDVMAFASNADRTNAVALALTVLQRNFWPGAKPIGVVTSTKSHGGKDTIVAFAAGTTPKLSVSYEATGWAFQKSFIAELKHCPETGVLNVENARLGRGEKFIASAFLERFITDPEPVLHSSGVGNAFKLKNHLVLTISTNFGTVSEDLMNRALPIHLAPVGNVADRESPIGNPKLEFLPANRERIEAELRGMIEKWKEAGMPLDMEVRHPFTAWARTVGGILMVNGFKDFLANYSLRKTADDPERLGLALLGADRPDEWLRADDWARLAVNVGVAKTVILEHDRDTDRGRARGIGGILSAHEKETFEVETEDETLTLKLEKARRRFEGGPPTTRYRFMVISKAPIPEDAPADGTPERPMEVEDE